MAQPSIASYFHTRKRNAVGELKNINSSKSHLVNEDNELDHLKKATTAKKNIFAETNYQEAVFSTKTSLLDVSELSAKVISAQNDAKPKPAARKVQKATKPKKAKEIENQGNIQELFNNMARKEPAETIVSEKTDFNREELLKTPPSSPTRINNAMDKVKAAPVKKLNLNEIRQRVTRSSRLAELKASIARFKENDNKLKEIEKKTNPPQSPVLKPFKSIQLEVTLSPTKAQPIDKIYLSPKKDLSARRNLLNELTPTKNVLSVAATSPKKLVFTPEKPSLTLPFKYRSMAEMFRSVDTVCQIFFNRKELITFKKLKPAVEELSKRNLLEKHLAQIKSIYPDAFKFSREKIRAYGTKQEEWELVVEPQISGEAMSSEIILERRRFLFNTLIHKIKNYHREFLMNLDPPMNISIEKITRWHPEFDIERVPDIELGDIPQPPQEERLTTGKDVLEKAKLMFNCNTRMEQALERLKHAQEKKETQPEKPKEVPSVLKGIPQAILDRVRQKQAAKALESMTRTDAKDKEIQHYSRLPALARLTRNLFVSEKKSVLQVDLVLEKLTDSIPNHMPKSEIESHLKTLAKELPTWISFLDIRSNVYIKIKKDIDVSLVINKLDKLLKRKKEL